MNSAESISNSLGITRDIYIYTNGDAHVFLYIYIYKIGKDYAGRIFVGLENF